MNILITGASGFVGSQIVTDLIKAGHQVICCVRNPDYAKKLFPQCKIVYCDFLKSTKKEDWTKHLDGVDIVINTVGIFYHPLKKIIWATHYEAPHALFDACVEKKIKKIIHISALGVDRYSTDYAKSKKAADDYLLTLPVPSFILRPSLIYGRGSYGGTSLFRGLVGLPGIIPIPGNGKQEFQPIYLPDLAKAILKLIDVPLNESIILSPVGNKTISLKEILTTLREWLGFSKAIALSVPRFFIRLGSFFGDLIPYSTINSSGYKMLFQNNIATEEDTKKFINLIGFTPLDFVSGIFNQPSTVQDHWHAKLYFVKPLLQLSLAFLWIFSGLVSAFFYSKTASYGLLEQAGISSTFQPFFLYAASALDVILGLALLFNFQVKKICILQILLILFYTAIITWKLPYFWLEPFGSITKNIPLIISIYILYVLESGR